MMFKRMAVAAAVLVAAVCGTAPAVSAVPAAESVFTFDAEAGAHPVSDRSGVWSAPGHEIMVWEYDAVVKIDAATWSGADYIRVELNGAGGAPLTTGHYPDARNQGDLVNPGMQVISNGLGCADHYGEFTITRIERDIEGALTALVATFTQRCGDPGGPALHGSIQFEA